MNDRAKYVDNCKWLRDKFNINASANIYLLLNTAVDYIKSSEIKDTVEPVKQEVKSLKGEEKCQKKPSKKKKSLKKA